LLDRGHRVRVDGAEVARAPSSECWNWHPGSRIRRLGVDFRCCRSWKPVRPHIPRSFAAVPDPEPESAWGSTGFMKRGRRGHRCQTTSSATTRPKDSPRRWDRFTQAFRGLRRPTGAQDRDTSGQSTGYYILINSPRNIKILFVSRTRFRSRAYRAGRWHTSHLSSRRLVHLDNSSRCERPVLWRFGRIWVRAGPAIPRVDARGQQRLCAIASQYRPTNQKSEQAFVRGVPEGVYQGSFVHALDPWPGAPSSPPKAEFKDDAGTREGRHASSTRW
jgi:hypothetical protein